PAGIEPETVEAEAREERAGSDGEPGRDHARDRRLLRGLADVELPQTEEHGPPEDDPHGLPHRRWCTSARLAVHLRFRRGRSGSRLSCGSSSWDPCWIGPPPSRDSSTTPAASSLRASSPQTGSDPSRARTRHGRDGGVRSGFLPATPYFDFASVTRVIRRTAETTKAGVRPPAGSSGHGRSGF